MKIIRKISIFFSLTLIAILLAGCSSQAPSGTMINGNDQNQENANGNQNENTAGLLLPQKTSFSAPLSSIAGAMMDSGMNVITVGFRNDYEKAITLPLTGSVKPKEGSTCSNPVLSAAVSSGEVVAGVTRIEPGTNFLMFWDCDDYDASDNERFTADLKFEFTDSETGRTLSHSGTIQNIVYEPGPKLYVPENK